MSTINTNGIDANYPVPGINNSSQGFRDNFAAIKNNINIAGNEITDLQNKVVLKAALDNTVINNDMANTLISNASTRSFRATTYNLGNSLSGTVVVDVSLGDVQYGTVSGNVTFEFGSWAPTGTQSNVELQLSVSNANAVITFPSAVVFANNNFGVTTLENYANSANTPTVTVPYGVSQLDYRLSTTDCGANILIEPYNRPRIATQIQTRSPAPTGFPGDVSGTVAVDPSVNQLTLISSNTTSDYFTTSGNTTQLYPGMAVVFTGTSYEANITSGTTYYVRNVVSANTFTVATSRSLSANVDLEGSLSSVVIANTSGGFSCSAAALPLAIGQQLEISGTIGGTGSITGYSNPTTYYIIATNGSTTFQLSTSIGGPNITTTAGTPTGLTYKIYNGNMYLNPITYMYVATDDFNSTILNKTVSNTTVTTNDITLNNTTSLVVNAPIIFTGTTFGGITANSIYYIKTISSSGPNITVSATRTNGVADTAVTLTTASGNSCNAAVYVGNDIWKRIPLNSW